MKTPDQNPEKAVNPVDPGGSETADAPNQNKKQRKEQKNEHLETIVRQPLKVASSKD
jgi:hypothetical protein